jgi:hypothetical protein
MQFWPCQTSSSTSNFSVYFIFGPLLGFMQFDPQLTIKLLMFFNFTHVFNQIESLEFDAFLKKIFGCEFL